MKKGELDVPLRPGHEFGARVATALAGSWRSLPPMLTLTDEVVADIAPYLLRTGAAGLVWWRAQQSELRASAIIHSLGQVRWRQNLEALLHERNVRRLIAYLRSGSVDPILIKGWSIACLYPEPGLRPYADIDICVHPDHLERAVTLLSEHGIQSGAVDLHGNVADLEYRKWRQLYERSRLVRTGPVEVRILSAEDQLRHLCLHLLRHGVWRPLWLCDVAAALESLPPGFDWDYCLSGPTVRSEWVLCAMGLARRLLGAHVTDPAIARQADRLPSWLVAAVLREWGSPFPGDSHSRDIRPFMAYWKYPTESMRALRLRWPNSIEALFKMGARPGTKLPRFWFQVRACLRRGARLPSKLWPVRSANRLSLVLHLPE